MRDPGRTIPRAIVWSVALVAALYLLMNTSVLGTMPWQELVGQAGANARLSVAAVVVQRAYGAVAGRIVALLVVWTAFASVYALLLGYSRVPYAAALDDNYFRIFARVHPRHRIPNVSLLMLAGVSMVFCVLQLADLVAALVVIRILLQFLLQQVGVMVLRHTQPEMERPFRIWLYPLPPLVAIAGFLYILFSRPHFAREIFFAMVVVLTGTATYLLRAYKRREWPFAQLALFFGALLLSPAELLGGGNSRSAFGRNNPLAAHGPGLGSGQSALTRTAGYLAHGGTGNKVAGFC